MKTFFCVLLLALPLIAYAPSADACACCSEHGDRVESISKLDGYQKGELEKVRFGKKARLYMNAAGAAGVQGIQGVGDSSDGYEITQARAAADKWTFTFKDAKGRTGTLAFTLPSHIESFFVDQQDGKPGGAGDPVLYKEWRINAPVTGTGIFAGVGTAGAPIVRLVLQGRGNSCTSADQFTSFSMIVSGPSARFSFFGPLATPAP
jgi:hypothetical protein